jgi:hypothetical protein
VGAAIEEIKMICIGGPLHGIDATVPATVERISRNGTAAYRRRDLVVAGTNGVVLMPLRALVFTTMSKAEAERAAPDAMRIAKTAAGKARADRVRFVPRPEDPA